MSNIRIVFDDLTCAVAFYRGIILSSNYYRNDRQISWSNYIPGIKKNMTYAEEYQNIIDSRQYSLLFNDGGAAQFYYEFDDHAILSKARLAYYPVPFEAEDAEMGSDFAYHDEYISRVTNGEYFSNLSQTHFRIDFYAEEALASPCHIQYGGLNQIRINFKKLLCPLAFMDFIAASLYASHRLALFSTDSYKSRLSNSVEKSFHVDYDFGRLIYVSHE